MVPKTVVAARSPISESRERQEAARPPDVIEVAKRAYERFLARAGGPGSAEEDWLAAERELADSDDPRSASPTSN
jgi:hypothetical protein